MGTVQLAGGLDNQAVRVRPGVSPGTMNFISDYAQSSDGVLEIELAGNAVDKTDLLDVTGTATLGGNLEVVLIEDFVPRSRTFHTHGSQVMGYRRGYG